MCKTVLVTTFLSCLACLGLANPIIDGVAVGHLVRHGRRTSVVRTEHHPFIVNLSIVETRRINPTQLMHLTSRCAGIIISNEAILTAAHCLQYQIVEPKITAIAGVAHLSYEQNIAQTLTVKSYVLHSDFVECRPISETRSEFCFNDIAILMLETHLRFDEYVKKATFGVHDISHKSGYIYGWGDMEKGRSTEMLQRAELNVISKRVCQGFFEDAVITDNMICLLSESKTKGACLGDSGGPLVIDGKVYGLSSFNRLLESKGASYCDPKEPSIFTNIPSYFKWIDEKLGEHKKQERKRKLSTNDLENVPNRKPIEGKRRNTVPN